MQEIQVIEMEGQRVLTTKQLAEAYETETQVVINNFNRNKDRYTEGKHYVCLKGKEKNDFINKNQNDFSSYAKAKGLYLWTEKGALLHAKSLNTEKAWQVYDYLVDFYFRVKEEKQQETEIITSTKNMEVELKDSIKVFREMMEIADELGICVRVKSLLAHKSILKHNRIGIAKKLTFEEVAYELAYELACAIMYQGCQDRIIDDVRVDGAAHLLMKGIDMGCFSYSRG